MCVCVCVCVCVCACAVHVVCVGVLQDHDRTSATEMPAPFLSPSAVPTFAQRCNGLWGSPPMLNSLTTSNPRNAASPAKSDAEALRAYLGVTALVASSAPDCVQPAALCVEVDRITYLENLELGNVVRQVYICPRGNTNAMTTCFASASPVTQLCESRLRKLGLRFCPQRTVATEPRMTVCAAGMKKFCLATWNLLSQATRAHLHTLFLYLHLTRHPHEPRASELEAFNCRQTDGRVNACTLLAPHERCSCRMNDRGVHFLKLQANTTLV